MSIIEKYTNCQDKLFMTIDEAIELAHELARLAKDKDINYVVGIENGAALLTRVISEDLKLPLEMLCLRRKGSLLKEKLSRYPFVIGGVSKWYKISGLNLLLIWMMKRMTSISRDVENLPLHQFEGKHILLVDDAIETGETIELAKKILYYSGCLSITTCVITWSETYSREHDSLSPDIYIGRRIQHYPWSFNSPFYKNLEQWLEENKHIS